jgi:membrane fusion protein, hemolysin D
MKLSDRAVAPVGLPVPPRARQLRPADGTAFLPAALEIIETPPSPIGRAIALTLICAFCVALAWASLGKVDMIASAQGKIIPTGRSKIVQPFETGVVSAIHVSDGQRVKAGDLLIELDPTIDNAELRHLQSDLVVAKLDVARLRAALADGDPFAAFKPPSGAPEALLATQQELLLDQTGEQRAKLAALDRQRAQREAEKATYAATIAKIEAMVPILQQRVDIRKYLMEREVGSKVLYLQDLSQLVEQQKELGVQQGHLQEAEAGLAAIIATRQQAVEEYRRTRLGELATAEAKAAGLAQDVIRAAQRARLQILRAPVDGTVQQLAVHTIGGVVTPAQALLEIVPADSHLEIEAMVQNHDIGFVHPGQSAEIKVDTFSFTKYGLLHGTVLNVSADSIDRSKPPSDTKKENSATSDSLSEPQGHELVYAAHVSLDRTAMEVEGRNVPLSPGMAVTVEIKTGAQRVITYLLSPLLRFKQESLRER